MSYFYQKIKSIETIKPNPKMHRQIMRRAFYIRFRNFKEPFLILVCLAFLTIAIDSWQILALKSQAIQSIANGFRPSPMLIFQIPILLIIKGLAHPELLVGLVADFLIAGYLTYLLIRFDKISAEDNKSRLAWHKYLFRKLSALKLFYR